MIKLSIKQILMLHTQLIEQTGGNGVRDYNLLESAVETLLLALNGIELVYTQKELYEMILDVAEGKQGYEELLHWVLEHQN